MTIKRSQLRDGCINNTKIASDADINTSKLRLYSDFAVSTYSSYTVELGLYQVIELDITALQLPQVYESSDFGVVVSESLGNWVELYEIDGNRLYFSDATDTDENLSQYLVGRLTNLQYDSGLTDITGVQIGYVSSNCEDNDLFWDSSGETLTWNSGVPVEIAQDGAYLLVGEDEDSIVVIVDYSSLPVANQTDSLTFVNQDTTDKYTVGLFYYDVQQEQVLPVISQIEIDCSVLIPIVRPIDELGFNSFSNQDLPRFSNRVNLSFSDLKDVTKTSGEELLTSESLILNDSSLTSGALLVGYYNERLDEETTVQEFLGALDVRTKTTSRASLLATSPYVIQSGDDIVVTISSSGTLSTSTATELSTIVQSTMRVFYNGTLLYPSDYSHSLIGTTYTITILDTVLAEPDFFEFFFEWLPNV